MTRPRTALVAGGGIAGATTALALQKAGIEPIVLVAGRAVGRRAARAPPRGPARPAAGAVCGRRRAGDGADRGERRADAAQPDPLGAAPAALAPRPDAGARRRGARALAVIGQGASLAIEDAVVLATKAAGPIGRRMRDAVLPLALRLSTGGSAHEQTYGHRVEWDGGAATQRS